MTNLYLFLMDNLSQLRFKVVADQVSYCNLYVKNTQPCMYTCTHTHTLARAHTHSPTHTHTHTPTHTHTHTHTHTRTHATLKRLQANEEGKGGMGSGGHASDKDRFAESLTLIE